MLKNMLLAILVRSYSKCQTLLRRHHLSTVPTTSRGRVILFFYWLLIQKLTLESVQNLEPF